MAKLHNPLDCIPGSRQIHKVIALSGLLAFAGPPLISYAREVRDEIRQEALAKKEQEAQRQLSIQVAGLEVCKNRERMENQPASAAPIISDSARRAIEKDLPAIRSKLKRAHSEAERQAILRNEIKKFESLLQPSKERDIPTISQGCW